MTKSVLMAFHNQLYPILISKELMGRKYFVHPTEDFSEFRRKAIEESYDAYFIEVGTRRDNSSIVFCEEMLSLPLISERHKKGECFFCAVNFPDKKRNRIKKNGFPILTAGKFLDALLSGKFDWQNLNTTSPSFVDVREKTDK